MLWQITAKHFVAGVVLERHKDFSDFYVTDAAPIVRYMIGWPISRVQSYCNTKGWTIIAT